MPQAERCNDAQRHLHTQRQRALGERMHKDHDRPRRIEVVVVILAVAALAAYANHYNLYPFN